MNDAQYEHLYEARKARNERNTTIEECARVAENCVHPVMDIVVAERYRYVAAAIRALKDKP